MNKQAEMEKLFDAVVEYKQKPDDPFLLQSVREQRNKCRIIWPQETIRTCKTALIYFENHQNGSGARA